MMTSPTPQYGLGNNTPNATPSAPHSPFQQVTPPQAKPFYTKWWFIAIAVLVGLVLIGSLTNPKSKNSTKDAEPSTASTTTESSAEITVPNVVGMRGDEARATLEALGKVDISFKDESGKKMVLDVTNWTVTSQTPEAGATLSKGAKVTLFVHHDTDDAEPKRARVVCGRRRAGYHRTRALIRVGLRAAARTATSPPWLRPNRAVRPASTKGQAPAASSTASRSASSVSTDMPVIDPAVGAPPPRKEGTTATAPAVANRCAIPATRSPDSPKP